MLLLVPMFMPAANKQFVCLFWEGGRREGGGREGGRRVEGGRGREGRGRGREEGGRRTEVRSFLPPFQSACHFMLANCSGEEEAVRDLFRTLIYKGRRDVSGQVDQI